MPARLESQISGERRRLIEAIGWLELCESDHWKGERRLLAIEKAKESLKIAREDYDYLNGIHETTKATVAKIDFEATDALETAEPGIGHNSKPGETV